MQKHKVVEATCDRCGKELTRYKLPGLSFTGCPPRKNVTYSVLHLKTRGISCKPERIVSFDPLWSLNERIELCPDCTEEFCNLYLNWRNRIGMFAEKKWVKEPVLSGEDTWVD